MKGRKYAEVMLMLQQEHRHSMMLSLPQSLLFSNNIMSINVLTTVIWKLLIICKRLKSQVLSVFSCIYCCSTSNIITVVQSPASFLSCSHQDKNMVFFPYYLKTTKTFWWWKTLSYLWLIESTHTGDSFQKHEGSTIKILAYLFGASSIPVVTMETILKSGGGGETTNQHF